MSFRMTESIQALINLKSYSYGSIIIQKIKLRERTFNETTIKNSDTYNKIWKYYIYTCKFNAKLCHNLRGLFET